MKTLGIILASIAIVLAGVYKRAQLSERLKAIKLLLKETDRLTKGITVYKKPIGEITEGLVSPPFGKNFSCEENKEKAFRIAYEAVQEIKKCSLGDEKSILERMREELETIKEEAEKDLNDKGMMYIKTSVCLALLFVVIMI